MNPARREIWQARPVLLVLLLCALLLRTLVPAGFMIGPAASGAPALLLCPDSAPVPDHPSQHHHAPRHAESPCPYAALAAPALPPTPLLFVPPAWLAPVSAGLQTFAILRPALAAPPPPATGPPVSVRF